MAIDRQFGFFFSFFIVMMFAVVIAIYSAMYTLKDGLVLAIALGVLTIILGDPEITYVYYPISVITGIAYSFGLSRNWKSKSLMLVSIVVFIIGECLVAYIISPLLLNISIADQIAPMAEVVSSNEAMKTMLDLIGDLKNDLFLIAFVLGTIFAGLVEGACIHLVTVLLLRKFRIKDVKASSVIDIKPNAILAYISMGFVFLSLFSNRFINNETLFIVTTTISTVCEMILMFYGIVYFMLLGIIRFRRNISLLVILATVLLFPFSLFVLMIYGFLFAAGPLYNKLQKERFGNEKNNTL